ncbi:hypothetical protein SEVIR_9G164466v4 [Setaria viridis]
MNLCLFMYKKSSRDDIEYVNPPYDHPESETMQMRSPQREGHTSLQTDSTTQGIKIMLHLDVQRTCRDDIESVTPAHEHARTKTMQMRSLPWERQTSLQRDSITQDNKTMPHLDVQRTRRDDIEYVNPAHDHPETMPMRSTPRERQTFMQGDSTVQGNKTNPIVPAAYLNSSGNHLLSDNNGLQLRDQAVSQSVRVWYDPQHERRSASSNAAVELGGPAASSTSGSAAGEVGSPLAEPSASVAAYLRGRSTPRPAGAVRRRHHDGGRPQRHRSHPQSANSLTTTVKLNCWRSNNGMRIH